MSSSGKLNMYIAIALISGIIACLAFSIYYGSQLANGSNNPDSIPVDTVIVTAIVTVTENATASCTGNQSLLVTQTVTC